MSNSITSVIKKNTLLQKLGLGLFISTTFVCSFSTKSLASTFNYSSDEIEIFNTDFDTSQGWLLESTKIDNGMISATNSWGKASYNISPLNLDNGDILLYWSAILPQNAKTERDKFYIGLQYSDNDAVDYNGGLVDENAELKMAIRPEDKLNEKNSYNQIYIDPDFDPVDNFSPATTRVQTQNSQITDFRLKISKVNKTIFEASSFFWNGLDWELMSGKQGYNSSLEIQSSDWLNAKDEVESPVTFEAVNLLFRNQGSAVTAVALTQVQGNNSAKIPEPSTIIGLPLIFVLGTGLKQKRITKKR
jgi:hypothetical protein